MTGNYFLLITFSFLLSIVIAVRNNGLPFPRSIAASVVQKSELAKYLSVSLLFSCGNVARAGITELVRSPTVDADQLVIPLDKIDGIYYVKYVIGGALFRAIVDTGSPFLIVPSICTRQWGGCRVRYLPTEASSKTGRQSNALAESAAEGNLSADPSSYELPIMVNNGVKLADTKLSPTVEIFGGQDYDVDWKMADVSFPALSPMPTAVASTDRNLPQSQLSSVILKDVIVGQAGLDIMRPPGGVFFGLIKDTRSNIRPSFLSQTNFRSFKLDTSTNTLTLSKTSMIMPATKLNDPFPLVQDRIVVPLIDLRSFGDPVCHYAAKVSKLIINEVEIDQFKEIYAIFDTGSTGCVLSDEIANDEGTPVPPRSVKVVLETERSVYDDKPSSVTLEAKATRDNIFVVTTVNIPWFKKTGLKDNVWKRTSNRSSRRRPQIIVLGLPFLKNKSLIVDTDTKRLSIEEEV